MTDNVKKLGPCDICEKHEAITIFKHMNLCLECYDIEYRTVNNAEVKPVRTIEHIQKVDQTLKVRTDIYNAEIASLTEIQEAINADDRIVNKHFKYCEAVQERIEYLKKLIFERQNELNEMHTKARAAQQSLMETANKLRAEEREKLKLQDLSYKPSAVKISKPKLVSVKKKVDRGKVAECVEKLNDEFPESKFTDAVFQMIMVAKGRGPEDTYFDLRKKLKEGKSA